MQTLASRTWQGLVDRFKKKSVHKTIPIRFVGNLAEETDLSGLSEGLNQGTGLRLAEKPQHLRTPLATEHRSHRKQFLAARRQTMQAPEHHIADRRRNLRGPPPPRTRRGLWPFHLEQAHDLAHEEWIAFAAKGDGIHPIGRRFGAQQLGDQHPHLVPGEPLHGQATTRVVAGHFRQRLREQFVARSIVIAHRDDHQQRQVSNLSGQQTQKPQRPVIRRLQIVEQEQDRSACGRAG